MLAVLSKRLRRFSALIEDLSLKEVPAGSQPTFSISAKQKPLRQSHLDISKTQLASLLGTIPETLSRILARMSTEDFIESDGHRTIKILDRDALKNSPAASADLPSLKDSKQKTLI